MFGAVIGSFLNVCILRIPEGTFLQRARSHCPSCDKVIPAWHNIPVISWLLLRGKAACCGARISTMYPVIELLTIAGFILVFKKYNFIHFTHLGIGWDAETFIRCIHMITFTCLMIVVSGIDFRLQIIPDVISYPMILASGFWVWVHPGLNWSNSLLGIVVGGGILYAVAWLYYLIRRETGMGLGDVKLLAAIGGWLGVEAVIPTLFFGSVVGAIFGLSMMMATRKVNLKSRLSFGPFLAGGAWVHMMYGRELMILLML